MAKGNGNTRGPQLNGIRAIDAKFDDDALSSFNGDVASYVASMQKFDKAPTLISENEFERMLQSGDFYSIQRDIVGDNSRDLSEQLKRGDYRLGDGNFGRAIYFADNAEYGNKLFRGRNDRITTQALISKKARIGVYEELREEYRSEHWMRGSNGLKHSFELTDSFGTWAMAKGYDAVRVRDSLGIVLVYNRGKLIMRK